MANYLCQAQQKWAVTPVAKAGGYPGSPYFKIAIAGTERTLAVGEDNELIALPAFTGGDAQLWRLDQLTDRGWALSLAGKASNCMTGGPLNASPKR
jgi:arabinan endo-1,5-alpha-L-arabinosidase